MGLAEPDAVAGDRRLLFAARAAKERLTDAAAAWRWSLDAHRQVITRDELEEWIAPLVASAPGSACRRALKDAGRQAAASSTG